MSARADSGRPLGTETLKEVPMTDTLVKDAAAKPQGTAPDAIKSGIVAYLCVEGAVKAGALYKKAFGASEVHLQPVDDKGRTMHLHLHINGASLMLGDPYPE